MTIFVVSFIVMLLAVVGMTAGILAGRPAIKGSCGGLNQIGLGGECGGGCAPEEKEICALKKAAQETK